MRAPQGDGDQSWPGRLAGSWIEPLRGAGVVLPVLLTASPVQHDLPVLVVDLRAEDTGPLHDHPVAESTRSSGTNEVNGAEQEGPRTSDRVRYDRLSEQRPGRARVGRSGIGR